jgi:nucleotide-binding universal stress UspA family protein
MKILIAHDGSDCSKAAIVDLRRAAMPKKARAMVCSIADVPVLAPNLVESPNLSPEYVFAFQNAYEHGKDALREAEGFALEGAVLIKKLFPDWEVAHQAVTDSPSHGIVEKANAWNPDLLVVGSHGHSVVGRLLFGSTSMSVLNRVGCSVRIGRGRIMENLEPVRVVLAVDGSEPSMLAADKILERPWPKGSAIHIVTAVDARIVTAIAFPSAAIKKWFHEKDQDPLAWALRMHESLQKKMEHAGLIVSTLVKEEDPKDVLLDEAADWGADCIFLGSRGLGLGERLFLGSVSSAIAARAHCSVEIIKGGS